MNVKQLIEQLQALDPELIVVRSGYEGGLTEVDHITPMEVLLNVNHQWYYGEHEEADEHEVKKHPHAARAKAVELT